MHVVHYTALTTVSHDSTDQQMMIMNDDRMMTQVYLWKKIKQ